MALVIEAREQASEQMNGMTLTLTPARQPTGPRLIALQLVTHSTVAYSTLYSDCVMQSPAGQPDSILSSTSLVACARR